MTANLSIQNTAGEWEDLGEVEGFSRSDIIDRVESENFQSVIGSLPRSGEIEFEIPFHICSSFLFDRAEKDKYFFQCQDEDCKKEMVLNFGVDNGR